MSDLVERLRAHKADIWNWNGEAMTAWDSWRSAIAKGDKSSWPRDAFESLIGEYGADMEKAADRIEQLEAALRELLEADDNLRELMPRRVSEALIEGALIRVRTAKDKARAAMEVK